MKAKRTIRAAFGVAEVLLIGSVIAASCPQHQGSADTTAAYLSSDPVLACQGVCDGEAGRSMQKEIDRHQGVVSECGEDPDCLGDAELLHTAILAEIEENRLACRQACVEARAAGPGS
jgi:hypothetical protein